MTTTIDSPPDTDSKPPRTSDAARRSAGLAVAASLAAGLLLLIAAMDSGTSMRADGIRSIAATAAVFALPLAIGGLFRVNRWWGLLAESALRYALGTLAILAVGWIVFTLGGAITVVAAMTLVMAAGSALVAAGVVWQRGLGRLFTARPRPTVIIGALVAVGVALAAAVYWRRWSGPPLQPIWDGLIHLSAINKISAGEFSLLLSDLTSAFQLNAYLPSQHLRIAIVENITGVDGLRIYWGGPFVVLPLAAFGVFELTRRAWHSVVGSAAAAAVIPFVEVLTKGPAPLIHLVPASEAVALSPFILGALISTEDRRTAWMRAASIAALMLPIHFVHGLLLLGLLLAAFVVASLRTNRIAAMVAGLLAMASGALFAFAGSLRSRAPRMLIDPTGDYASVTPDADLAQRMLIVHTHLPGLLLGLTALVVGAILVIGAEARRLRLAAFAWAVLVAYWIPVITFERLHAFLLVAAAVGVAAGVAMTESAARRWVPEGAKAFVSPGLALVLLLTAFVGSDSLTEPIRVMRDRQLTNTDLVTTATSIAPYEILGIARFAEVADLSLPAVSDPVGQSTLEAFGGFTTVNGPYQPDWLREDLRLATTTVHPGEAREALARVQDGMAGEYYLMLTARTYHWAYAGRPEFAWEFRPRLLSLLPSSPVPYNAPTLMAVLAATGCMNDTVDYGEIVFMRVDCA